MSKLSNTISSFISENGGTIESTLILLHFRVPLLILHMKDGFRIDIQFPDDNFQAIRNSHLIRCYAECDQRMILLVIWLRTLFDALNIRQSAQGLLSMYHILLLTIHFLQNEKVQVQSDKFCYIVPL
uniref:Uncharacterized protein n=1 Tax=Heterorhabditis bacteriophora TaxID=37862 RepID=A0A1I7XEF3_HETBA